MVNHCTAYKICTCGGYSLPLLPAEVNLIHMVDAKLFQCDVRRFGQLRRQIGEITESSLTKQLRELETDGFILRHDFCEVPPRVEYTLTELGKSFLSVLDCMKAWGDENLPT